MSVAGAGLLEVLPEDDLWTWGRCFPARTESGGAWRNSPRPWPIPDEESNVEKRHDGDTATEWSKRRVSWSAKSVGGQRVVVDDLVGGAASTGLAWRSTTRTARVRGAAAGRRHANAESDQLARRVRLRFL